MKKKIFYSIEVECENEDVLNFVRLNNPTGFQYEYIEDVKGPELHSVFQDIFDCFDPIKNQKFLDEC